MELSALAEIMKKKGVVGAGGAGFPSGAKLNPKADTVILNCAECEPLFRVHRQALAKYAKEIIFALNEVKTAAGADNAIIGVKGSYKQTIQAVRDVVAEYPGITIKKLPEIYPAGDEVILIYETTGRTVKPGCLPITEGVIVYNVETMLNVYNAIKHGKPVTTKLVTVAGAVKNPQTFNAPIGITAAELVALAGGESIDNPAYLSGGVMTGRLITPSDVVTKTTNAILVLPDNHQIILKRKQKNSISLNRAKSVCCQCRMCTDLCSRHLLGHPIEPHKFMRAVAHGDTQDLSVFINTMYCSQCGLCEMYSCGQGLSPRTLIGKYKAELRKNGVKPEGTPEFTGVSPDRELRRVPMSRLITKLGLTKYNVSAPINETEVTTNTLKIMLSQHIGSPAKAVVSEGESVKACQMIATTEGALGSDIHSPADGIVDKVTDKYILIERTNR